jgi:hypothetical protein
LKIRSLSVCPRVFNSVLFLLLIFVLAARPLKADTSHLYVPAMRPVTGVNLGLAFINTGIEQGQVEIAARTYDGGLVKGIDISNPVTLTVTAGTKQELSVVDIFGSGISDRDGWLDISILSGNVKAFSLFFDSASTLIESAELLSGPSNRLVFPQISAGSSTRLSVVNTAAESVAATVSVYDNSGRVVDASQIDLALLSGFSADVRTLFAVDDGFEGYAVVTTSGSVPSLVGLESFQSQSDIAVVRGLPVSAQTKNGYWAHFTSQSGYGTTLTLLNAADEAQTFQVTATVEDVPLSFFQTITLLPNERLQQDVAQFFSLPETDISGLIHFEAIAETPGILGVLSYGTTDGRVLTALEPWGKGESDLYFVHAQDDADYFTGFALFNPGANMATVLVDLINPDGDVARSASLTLASGERRTGLLSDIFQDPIDGAQGYVRVIATEPVIAVEMLGSRDSANLANMTAEVQQYSSFSADASYNNVAPTISSLSPSSAAINGMTSLNVQINGSGFGKNSFVNYDGVKLPTSFINSTLIAVTLSTLTVGSHSINVSGPGANAVSSNTVILVLNLNEVNQAPSVGAGANQTITLPASANLSGAATDDGLPTGSVLTTTWSSVSAPGAVTFGNVKALSTTASFSTSGSYVLRLTATDGDLSSFSDVTITVNPAMPTNQPPSVSAGSAQTITLPASANLSGTASDDGLPAGSSLTTTWSQVSGPGTVAFANVNALNTTAGFSTAGSYVLRLTASDGSLSSTSDVAITVNPEPTPGNMTIVTALALDKTTVTAGQTLYATVTYKNTGSSAITVNEVVIASRPPGGTNSGGPYKDLSPALKSTTVQAGATLLVSASRAFTSTDPSGVWYAYATYQDANGYHDGPSQNFTVSTPNQPPTVNAGPDQTITLPASANLSGSASDDGLPSGVLVTTWSQVSGPGAVTFGNSAGLSTTAGFSATGSYVLRLTASDGALSSSDDIAITVNAAVSSSPSSGSAFYVSPTGSDSNSGTSASPWRTIQKAANTVSAGATVIVMPGSYNERVVVSRSGASGSMIAFVTPSGGTRPVMRGFTINASYVRVDGFEITHLDSVFPNSNDDNDVGGVGVYINGSNVEAANNFIHDTARQGAKMLGSNNVVRNNIIKRPGHCGVYLYGQNQLVEGNDISDSIMYPAEWANPPSWADADGIVVEGSGHVIRKNYVHDINGADPQNKDPHIDCTQIPNGASNLTLEQNECSIPRTSLRCYQSGMFSGTITNFIIRNNVVRDMCRGYNFGPVSTVTGLQILNNTFVNIDAAPTELNGSTSGPVIKNNIYYNIGRSYVSLATGVSSPDIGNNLTYQVSGGSAYPGDLWGVDPRFVSVSGKDFHLQSTSPAIDKGLRLSSVPNDRDGTPRPQGAGYDIGAYEYQ